MKLDGEACCTFLKLCSTHTSLGDVDPDLHSLLLLLFPLLTFTGLPHCTVSVSLMIGRSIH